jgi:hypothetical protein
MYLIYILIRIPSESSVPYLWYFGAATMRALIMLAAQWKWLPWDFGYQQFYTATIIPLLVIAGIVALTRLKGASMLVVPGCIVLGVAIVIALGSLTKGGIWPVESGVYIAIGIALWCSLLAPVGIVGDILAFFTGALFLSRGWLVWFDTICYLKWPQQTVKYETWAFPLVSLFLTALLVLSLRPQMEAMKLLDEQSAVALSRVPTPEAQGYLASVESGLGLRSFRYRVPRIPN